MMLGQIPVFCFQVAFCDLSQCLPVNSSLRLQLGAFRLGGPGLRLCFLPLFFRYKAVVS